MPRTSPRSRVSPRLSSIATPTRGSGAARRRGTARFVVVLCIALFCVSPLRNDALVLVFSNMRAHHKRPQIRQRRVHIDHNVHPIFSLVPLVRRCITGWDTISQPTSGRKGGIHKRRNRRWCRGGSAEVIFHTASHDTHTNVLNERAWG